MKIRRAITKWKTKFPGNGVSFLLDFQKSKMKRISHNTKGWPRTDRHPRGLRTDSVPRGSAAISIFLLIKIFFVRPRAIRAARFRVRGHPSAHNRGNFPSALGPTKTLTGVVIGTKNWLSLRGGEEFAVIS